MVVGVWGSLEIYNNVFGYGCLEFPKQELMLSVLGKHLPFGCLDPEAGDREQGARRKRP